MAANHIGNNNAPHKSISERLEGCVTHKQMIGYIATTATVICAAFTVLLSLHTSGAHHDAATRQELELLTEEGLKPIRNDLKQFRTEHREDMIELRGWIRDLRSMRRFDADGGKLTQTDDD